MSAHSRPVAGPTSARRPGPRAAGVILLGVPGVLGFFAAFGTLRALVAGAVGLLLGAGIGWLSARSKLSALSTAAVMVVVGALAAGPAALPDTTVSGVVPTLDTGRALAAGVIRCWRDLLTATAPTGVLGDLLLVPYLTGLLGGVLGVVLALRVRRTAWAVLPTGTVLLVSVLLGTQEPVSVLVEGGVFAVLAVGWMAVTAQAWAAPGPVRAVAGLVLLAVAAVVGSVAGPAVTSLAGPRFVLRDEVEPPLDIRAYASPLNGFRKYVKEKDAALFSVSNLPKGARIRLATMDAFDGTVWNVAGGPAGGAAVSSGAFRRLPLDTGRSPSNTTVHVVVKGFTGVWLPDMGDVRSVTFTGPRAADLRDSLRYNTATGTAIVPAGLQAGDGYSFRADVAPQPSAQALDGRGPAVIAQPESLNVPPVISSVAADAVGKAQGAYAKAQAMATTLRTTGYFSDGLENQVASRAGHGSGRLVDLLGSQVWIGDAEQYAAAAGLMARELDLPSRVVMGFAVPTSGSAVIHGSDVDAWIEVDVDGVGWVPISVTPDKNRTPPQKAPAPAPKPKQATQQPPPPIEQPPPPLPATGNDQGNAQKSSSPLPAWLALVLTVAAWVGGPLLLIGLVVAVIVGLKLRRRRIRRRSGSTDQRVAAGWWEVVDAHRDFGATLPPTGTRQEIAGALGRPVTRELAVRADTAVFAGGVVTEDQATGFWELVDRELAELSSVGTRARWRARLSLRSLRRRKP
jgi:transglutaminase-like putative cysteine protease